MIGNPLKLIQTFFALKKLSNTLEADKRIEEQAMSPQQVQKLLSQERQRGQRLAHQAMQHGQMQMQQKYSAALRAREDANRLKPGEYWYKGMKYRGLKAGRSTLSDMYDQKQMMGEQAKIAAEFPREVMKHKAEEREKDRELYRDLYGVNKGIPQGELGGGTKQITLSGSQRMLGDEDWWNKDWWNKEEEEEDPFDVEFNAGY